MSDDARKQDAAGAEGDAGTSGKHALVSPAAGRTLHHSPDCVHRQQKPARLQVLTMGRVKAMIKEDVEVKSISTEACFAVAKATVRAVRVHSAAIWPCLRAHRSSRVVGVAPLHACRWAVSQGSCPCAWLQEELLEAMAGRAGQDMLNAGRSSLIYNDVGEQSSLGGASDF